MHCKFNKFKKITKHIESRRRSNRGKLGMKHECNHGGHEDLPCVWRNRNVVGFSNSCNCSD